MNAGRLANSLVQNLWSFVPLSNLHERRMLDGILEFFDVSHWSRSICSRVDLNFFLHNIK